MNQKIQEGMRWLVVKEPEVVGKNESRIVAQYRSRPSAARHAGPPGFGNFLRIISVAEWKLGRER